MIEAREVVPGRTVSLKSMKGGKIKAVIHKVGVAEGLWTSVTLAFHDRDYNDTTGFRVLYLSTLLKAAM